MTLEREKIGWVSVIKGIGILAVVLGHIATPLTPFIFSWHIPLFVFISGFFIKEENFLLNVKKDTKRLLVPFIVFSLFSLLVVEPLKRWLFPNFSFMMKDINYWEEIKGIFLWMDMGRLHHYGFVLWFLPALFWSRLFLFVLKKVFRVNILVFLLTLVSYSLTVNQKWILPFGIDKALIFMPWLWLGNIFFKKCKDNGSLKYLGIVSIILVFTKIPEINLSLKLVNGAFYGFIYSVVLIFGLIYVSKLLTEIKLSNFFKVMGNNSMLLLIIHPYVNNFSYILVKTLNMNWIVELLISIVLLFIIIRLKAYVEKTKHANIVNWI